MADTKTVKLEVAANYFESTVSSVYGGMVNGNLVIYLAETTIYPPQEQEITTEEKDGKKSFNINMKKPLDIRNIIKGKISIPQKDVQTIASWMIQATKQPE